jgi:hypothetical protein
MKSESIFSKAYKLQVKATFVGPVDDECLHFCFGSI